MLLKLRLHFYLLVDFDHDLGVLVCNVIIQTFNLGAEGLNRHIFLLNDLLKSLDLLLKALNSHSQLVRVPLLIH